MSGLIDEELLDDARKLSTFEYFRTEKSSSASTTIPWPLRDAVVAVLVDCFVTAPLDLAPAAAAAATVDEALTFAICLEGPDPYDDG